MGTIPTIPTHPAGVEVTSTYLNSIKAANDFWASTPRCYAYQSAALTMGTSATWYLVALAAEIYDIVQSGDSPMHDTATNNSRIYVRTSGKYEIAGAMEFVANGTGGRTLKVNKNSAGSESGGTLLVTQSQGTAGASLVTSVALPTIEVDLVAGDYIEMFSRQQSGGSLNSTPGAAQTWLRMKLTGS